MDGNENQFSIATPKDEWSQFKDQLEEYKKLNQQTYYTPYYPAPCPSCGRCPTCGRGGYWGAPYYYYSQQPWNTWQVQTGLGGTTTNKL